MPTAHATVLLGYLPVGKFDCYSDNARQVAKYQTFHSCIAHILTPLKEAARVGVRMGCADGKARQVWPIVAAYVADYPEQCLVACCMENRCPLGQIHPDLRGSHQPCLPRTQDETLQLLHAHESGTLDSQSQLRFKELGIRAVHCPFWADLPHTDIFRGFTPDLLHQLHKGVFKDHLVKWCTNLLGDDEIDNRFKTMPDLIGLRHFKNGISGVSQWTGHEHKEMEKVFVGLVAANADERVVRAVRALLDFIFLASLQRQTSVSLKAMEKALDDFHSHKQAFIDFEARHPAHFNIPKYHVLEHYVSLLKLFGSADGFNTEWSERLHIDYAKDTYHASNKKDYIIQMTIWLGRQEAVDRFTCYLYWYRHGGYSVSAESEITSLERRSKAIEPGTIEYFIPSRSSHHSRNVNVPPTLYHVPRNHPPALRAVSASQIITDHNAVNFLPALQAFLRSHACSLEPRTFDEFRLYKKITLSLPHIAEVSRNKSRDIVRASPPVPPAGRNQGSPAFLDFALVRTAEANPHTDGTNIQGSVSQIP